MAPDPKKGPQNGQKKKGYNPYNKFKNQSWNKKKKPNNDSAAKATDGRHPPNASHVPATSPVKVIQTPISKRATNCMANSVVSFVFFSHLYRCYSAAGTLSWLVSLLS